MFKRMIIMLCAVGVVFAALAWFVNFRAGMISQVMASLADPRVHYVRNDINRGVNGNFRRCVELVEAEHFVVMGCDDVMLPDYLATVAALARDHPQAVVIAREDRVAADLDAALRAGWGEEVLAFG